MRKTNNGAPPSLRQQGRALTTRYAEWALADAADEVMDDAACLGLPPPLDTVDEAEAAWILGITLDSLRGRRQRGAGPKLARPYGAPSYLKADLEMWRAAKLMRASR